jgi:hypothetical protein
MSVVLQKRRTLDLSTAEKGATCLFLDEECCFYNNKSGVVRDMARQLRKCITKRRRELANSWSFCNNIWSWTPWALPLAGPLFMTLLALLFRPCIINALSRFISQQVQRVRLQLLVKEYSPLRTHEPSIQSYQGPLETTQVNLWDECPAPTLPPPSPTVNRK